MKIKIEKNAFIAGLKKVSSVIGSRSTIPVISNVLVDAKDGQVSLHTTDLELSIKTIIPAEVLEEGTTTIPCKKLNEIINKLPSGTIELNSDDQFQSTIKCNRSFFRIVGMDPKEFPVDSEPEQTRTFVFPKLELGKNLKKISYAASSDDSRYVLNGILFSVRAGLFTVVATDGRRLALVEKVIEAEAHLDGDAVLPMKSVNEIAKVLEGEGNVTLKLGENKASFVTDDSLIITKLVDGNYPNFRHVIPASFNYSAALPRVPFTEALDRVSLVVSESNLAIKVAFGATEAVLSSSSSEIGESSEPMQISYDGDPMAITFNPKFIADPLKHLDCDDLVIKLNDNCSPISMSGDEGFLYVIMPMRNN